MTTPLLITGCPRSGNTLLLNLISTGFEGVHMLQGEQNPLEAMPEILRGPQEPPRVIVGKMPRLAMEVPDLLKANPDLKVIFTMRHPFAVLSSFHWKDVEHPWAPWRQWLDCAEMAERTQWNSAGRVVIIHFEALLTNPKLKQDTLAMWLGLTIARPFEECHEHFQDDEENIRAMHGVRPLDRQRAAVPIGKISQAMQSMGY